MLTMDLDIFMAAVQFFFSIAIATPILLSCAGCCKKGKTEKTMTNTNTPSGSGVSRTDGTKLTTDGTKGATQTDLNTELKTRWNKPDLSKCATPLTETKQSEGQSTN